MSFLICVFFVLSRNLVHPAYVFFHCACFTQELVEYYKLHSLKEGFSSLDTTLQVPYRELSNGYMPRAITKAASGECTSQSYCKFLKTACVAGESANNTEKNKS